MHQILAAVTTITRFAVAKRPFNNQQEPTKGRNPCDFIDWGRGKINLKRIKAERKREAAAGFCQMWLMWFVSQCLFLVEEFCWHARKPLWIQVKGIHHFKTSTFMHQSAEREFWIQFFNPLKFTISRSQDFTFGHPTCFHLFSLVHKIASLKGCWLQFLSWHLREWQRGSR